jgi:hypothetical protein
MNASQRMFSDTEWKEVRDAWEENHEVIIKVLKRMWKDCKPKSKMRRKLQDAVEREDMQINLILQVIDKLQKMDEILHRDDAGSDR